MCQVLEIKYTSFGIPGTWTILVPGTNFDGTYYDYFFDTQFFNVTFQTAKWRIVRNPAVPQWELDLFNGTVWVTDLGNSPDSICPNNTWVTPSTELIDILEVKEFDLSTTCTVWQSNSTNSTCCNNSFYDAIFRINPELESILQVGQYLGTYTNLFGDPEDTGSFQNELQGVRVLALVYLTTDNCFSFEKCKGGTFIGVLLQDSNGNLLRYPVCTRSNLLVLGVQDSIFEWQGEFTNCKKSYTFSSDWSGPLLNYRIYWTADTSVVPDSNAPSGTPGWVLEQEGITPGLWTPAGFLFNNNPCPYGQYVADFGGLNTRFSFTDATMNTGVLCFCYSEPEDFCYELLVWEKQCEFSKCVLNYVHGLMFGNVDCKALENLKLQRRILEILNCYDKRDIPENSKNYNNFDYTTIKRLLS